MSNLNLNIDSNNDNIGRRTEVQEQTQTRQEQPKMTQQSGAYSPFGYSERTYGTFGQRIHPNSGSEIFNKMVEVMGKALIEHKSNDAIDVIPLAREVHQNLNYSAIVVVRNNKVRMAPNAPQHNFVVAQILLIEASGEVLRPYPDDSSRRPVTITPTTEDANNSILVKYVSDILKAKYGEAIGIQLIDPIVVPRTLDLNNELRIRELTDASTLAVETRAHTRIPGFQDYNFIHAHGGSDLAIPVTVTMNGGETMFDLTNRPIYFDAQVSVSIERANTRGTTRQQVLNNPDESRRISDTAVMLDLVPVEPELLDENRVKVRGSQKFIPQVAWAPRLTARLTEQYLTRTPSGIMFAISSMSELARDRAWAQTFRGVRGRTKGNNLRDIGYLNIEANLAEEDAQYGEPIITTANEFSDRDLGVLLDNTVTRSPILAVDCYTTGVQAFTTTALYLAARGGKDAADKANRELMHSMNCATNGNLAKFISLDAPVVEGEGDLIHVGTWIDDAGKQRDIAELDTYLAMAVTGGTNNPQLVQDWMNTYYSRDAEHIRMADRLHLLESAAQGAVNITGTALRVQINAEVIQAFVAALAEGKLPLVSRTGEGDVFTTQRAINSNAGRSLYRGDGFGRSDRREGGRVSSRYAASRY